MKRRYALLALASAFSAPLPAHPLDGASMWVDGDARGEGEARPMVKVRPGAQAHPPAETAPSGKSPALFMTVFQENGTRQVTLDAPARHAAGLESGARRRGAWTVALGYRRETLDFNIAGPDGVPNILSELEWEVDMAEIRVNGEWLADNGFFMTGELAYASGFAGEERDSDYAFDNRHGEFSRSYAKSHGSTDSRVSLGLGWRFPPRRDVGITPMLGYTYQEQDLRSRKGRQVISTSDLTPFPGPFHGLDTHYEPRWHGPWLGLRVDAHLAERFGLRLGVKRQWFAYHADADWNLRDDFEHPRSFTQHGHSRGWQWEVGAHWRLSPQSAITFSLERHTQRLRNGTDRTFFADGQSSTLRLNGVNWDSWAASLGYRMDF